MSLYTESEFVPCYKGGRCEDAPCCGCGPESSPYDDGPQVDDYDYFDAYEGDDYDDEPFVDDDGPLWNEDAGMEAGLWGSEA